MSHFIRLLLAEVSLTSLRAANRVAREVSIKHRTFTATTLLLVALSAQAANAQGIPVRNARPTASFAFVQTRPVGELANNIGLGYGTVGTLTFPLDKRGVFSLRAEIGESQYGNETKQTAFSETVGDRVEVKVRTVNSIAPASLALQLALPSGPVRAYVNAGAGAQLFYTASRVEPTAGGYALAGTINQSDVAFAWTAGSGFSVPMQISARKFFLDVGAQYVSGAKAQYLAPGGIVDLPNGHVKLKQKETTTHLVALHFGARIEL